MTSQPSPASDAPILLRSDSGGVATLTLNRPDQRNALSVHLICALQDEFLAIENDPTVRVVIIAANGSSFCAGHDIKEIRANPGRHNYEALFKTCSEMMLTINRLPQPVIARVHAPATAAGCQLVATCDLAVAGRSAWFATPGVNIGLFCSTPMVPISRNVGRKQTMEMLILGDKVEPDEAERWGLINKVVEDEQLDATINEITANITSKSSLVMAIGKEAFYKQLEMDVESAYAYANEVIAQNLLARDAQEGIDAFLEKRTPKWENR